MAGYWPSWVLYTFLGTCPPTPAQGQHYFSLRTKCWFRGRMGWQLPRNVWSTWSMKAYYLVKRNCRFSRDCWPKVSYFLLLYQDITKPRAPISPSGRSTDRRPSAGMSPVQRGPKVKEHLRQPFLTHNIFAAHFVSWPEFWVGGAIAHPHFHRQSLVTEGIRPTGFPTMQSHVSFKSWLLLPCKIKFAFENVWVNCEGRRIYVSLLVLVLVLGATTGKLVENSPLSYYSWRSSL